MAAGHDQEAPDRVCVGTREGPRRCAHVAAIEFVVAAGRGGGRGSVYVERSRRCASCRPTRRAACAPPRCARRRTHARIRRRARARRRAATAWQSNPAPAPRAVADRRFRPAARIRRTRAALGWRARTRRATTSQFSDDGGDGARCAASPTARRSAIRCCLPESRDALSAPCAPRRARRDLCACRDRRSRSSHSARRRTRSSRRSRAMRRAARIRAALSGEQACVDAGRRRRRQRDAACCPRMARSKSARRLHHRAVRRRATARRRHGRTSKRSRSWSTTICRCPASNGGAALVAARHGVRHRRSRDDVAPRRAATTSRNHTDQPLPLTLVLAVRPFQVNPPAQFLNTPGGASPIRDARLGRPRADGERHAQGLSAAPPARVGAAAVRRGAAASSCWRQPTRASRARACTMSSATHRARSVYPDHARAARERTRSASSSPLLETRRCARARRTHAVAMARARAGRRRRGVARQARPR